MASHVLMYGTEPTLLSTRRMLLEAAHLRVTLTLDFREFKRMLMEADVDLLVLCHSLSLPETSAALSAIRTLRPDLKTLLFTALRPEPEDRGEAKLLSAFSGPQGFLNAVKRLLAA